MTDVVLLAVPVTARLAYYELFAKRGTSVLAEKPLAIREFRGRTHLQIVSRISPSLRLPAANYASVALRRLLVTENWFGPLVSISVSEGALTTKTGTIPVL